MGRVLITSRYENGRLHSKNVYLDAAWYEQERDYVWLAEFGENLIPQHEKCLIREDFFYLSKDNQYIEQVIVRDFCFIDGQENILHRIE